MHNMYDNGEFTIVKNKTQVITKEEQLEKISSQVFDIILLQRAYFNGNEYGTRDIERELVTLPYASNVDRFRTYAKFAIAYKELDFYIEDYMNIEGVADSKECFESLYLEIFKLINDKSYSDKFVNNDKPLSFKYNYVRTRLSNKMSHVNDACFDMFLLEKVEAVCPDDIYKMPACYVRIRD